MAVEASWVGQPRIKGSSEFTRMLLLTCSMIGLQFCWGTEASIHMTYASPYLLSLGLSKQGMSLVWIAGPLSGLIMQPLIGTISDMSTSKYGRRRPFMLGGTVLVCSCLLLLGWAGDVVAYFVADVERKREYTITLAVVDIFVLDFVINIAQTTCRALVVDVLPAEKQQLSSAWVSRMVGIGHLMIYGIGSLDLHAWFGNKLGNTQFKKVCVIASFAMAASQCLTCWAVEERVLVRNGQAARKDSSIGLVISQIYSKLLHLPERIQAICWVVFWSWIGWFPFLFYGSTWVGEIYRRHEVPDSDVDALTDVGRAGSQAFIIFAACSFICSIVLPWLVQSAADEERHSYTPRPPRSMEATLKDLTRNKPTLLTVWTISNLVFAGSMVFAPFVRSVRSATLIIAFCAVPWAVSSWAPGAMLGIEVNKMSSTKTTTTTHSRGASYHRLSNESVELEDAHILHLRHDSAASASDTRSTGEPSGIYLGILNIYTTLPQFVGTGISWVVFSLVEPGLSPELAVHADPEEHHSTQGPSGIAVCLFIGALSALLAAWATRRLRGTWSSK